MTKIERDDGQSAQTAYEYTYTGDGIRHMKKDYFAEKEYRYGCSIDCGGTPLRVDARELGSQGSWNSVEDYLQVGNALGYSMNWRFEYSGGEWLMMGVSGEPRQYSPQDSNGLAVQSEPSAPCVCAVQPQTSVVCPPLGSGSCQGGKCGEAPSVLPPGAPSSPGQKPRLDRITTILICKRPLDFVPWTPPAFYHYLIAACGQIFEVPPGSTGSLRGIPSNDCFVLRVTEHEKRCICSYAKYRQACWEYSLCGGTCQDFVMDVLKSCLLNWSGEPRTIVDPWY